MKDIVQQFITLIGDDPTREGLIETPSRVEKACESLFSGYKTNPLTIFKSFENEGYDGIVLLKDIEFYSFCEHHILPFYGKAHIAYIPNERIVGISKLARLLDVFCKRLQNQERITEQITETLMDVLVPKGAACVLEAKHLCIACRGVEKQHSVMTTSSMKGCFREDLNSRNELLQLIYGG